MGKRKNQTPDAANAPETAASAPPAPKTPRQVLIEWVKTIAIALVIWFVLQSMLVKSFRINSGSMENTLLPGEMLFVNRAVFGSQVPLVGYRFPAFREPRHDDLVVFFSPVPVAFAAELGIEPQVDVVKRLIGVPGDTLAMRNDSLFRNGAYVPEPYAQHRDPTSAIPRHVLGTVLRWQRPQLVGADSAYVPSLRTWGPLVLPADRYFVMGDNRDESVDSRFWGFLPRENMKGPVLVIYFSYDPSSWRPLPFLTAIRWGRLLHHPG
jgi:signal peptidase I